MELYLVKKISLSYNNVFSYFLNRIRDTRKFNLDEESEPDENKSKVASAQGDTPQSKEKTAKPGLSASVRNPWVLEQANKQKFGRSKDRGT